ncbi:MAG: hypothetical protein J6D16_00675 [Clostridia bacterium]|nr:hypothetical protein [Clostridia bacterium]
MAIQTVLGRKNKNELGIVTPHEHIFIELTAFYEKRELRDCESPETAGVTMDKLGILNRDPYALRDNLIMNDYETQKKELLRFKAAGGATVVDATMPGIGRDPVMLRRISEATDLNVVMGTGYYVCSTHPEEIKHMSEQEIADRMVDEIENGAEGTDIRAGVIGEIGISEIFGEEERRVLRAAALAHKKTGVGVLVHINPWTQNGLEASDILLASGVSPKKIAISHVDVENNMDYIRALLARGVYIEFDNFGKEYYVDREARRSGYGLFVHDTDRVDCLKTLIGEGYAGQLLLSCDVCLKTCLRAFGGYGYDHVLVNIVPMMQDAGISDADIHRMLYENPLAFLDVEEN